jgi:copper homeostasis protein CutC
MNSRESASFTSLQMAHWRVDRRNVTLCDLIPDRVPVSWLAVLTHGYVNALGKQIEVRSFDELERVQEKYRLSPLRLLRAQGLLTEGQRNLSNCLIDSLIDYSKGTVEIRTSGTGKIESINTHEFARLMSVDLVHDEMDAVSTNAAWYLRMRNDDALAFIAAPLAVVRNLEARCPAVVRAVPDDFLYAS